MPSQGSTNNMKKHFNTYFMPIGLFLVISFLIGFLLGCSIKSETLYGNISVPNLPDEQLIQEMESIYISLGQKFNKAEFLMAIMPDPAYVLTSSYTTFSGVYSVNMTTYTMPNGYGSGMFSGSGMTHYQYTDANAGIRGLILIAQLVNESKIRQLQERGYNIVVEFRRRTEEKRKNVEMEIEQFFVRNPDLREKKTLLAAILPWVASEKTFKSNTEMLDYAGNIARGLRTSKNLLTTWYGTFSQIDRFQDGTTQAGSNFITVNTQIVGNVLTGRGTLGSGEEVSLQANIKGGTWKGVVTNETAGATFQCEGTMTDTEFTASYWGSAWEKNLQGTVVLLTEKKKTSIYSFEEIKEWHNKVKDREWKKISESEGITHCYDTRNISYPSKGIVRVYTITYYESKKAINDKINQYRQLGLSTKGYENLYGTLTLQEINCNNKTYLPIYFMDYDKNRNPLNQSYDLSSNGWSEISSTMPTLEKLYKVVCPGGK